MDVDEKKIALLQAVCKRYKKEPVSSVWSIEFSISFRTRLIVVDARDKAIFSSRRTVTAFTPDRSSLDAQPVDPRAKKLRSPEQLASVTAPCQAVEHTYKFTILTLDWPRVNNKKRNPS